MNKSQQKRFHGIRASDFAFKSLKLMAVDDGVSMGEMFEKLVVAEWERRADGSPVSLHFPSSDRTSSSDAPQLNRRQLRALMKKAK